MPTKNEATAEQKLDQLRAVVAPVMAWYNDVLAKGEPDESYLYDVTVDKFEEKLSRGDFQAIIDILRTES
ncbi:hypothetical protein [Nocardia sp. NBC_01327]|uniref:hypothetical protein n=1 Tax=Nocardia sp. NBC_01327 TaxID=2903593 RepID=UPI002E0E36F6|nr:hypothetical protein OG326_23530 [Nocardia sp. NBC_01327]